MQSDAALNPIGYVELSVKLLQQHERRALANAPSGFVAFDDEPVIARGLRCACRIQILHFNVNVASQTFRGVVHTGEFIGPDAGQYQQRDGRATVQDFR